MIRPNFLKFSKNRCREKFFRVMNDLIVLIFLPNMSHSWLVPKAKSQQTSTSKPPLFLISSLYKCWLRPIAKHT